MKNSASFVAKRREKIVSLLETHRELSTAELAKKFDVSPLTIRRDLDFLEEKEMIYRHYGSAVLADPLGNNFSSKQMRAKKAIAKKAAQLVCDGASIFINSSSTALESMKYIKANDVTIMTNSTNVLKLPLSPKSTVLLTGGEIRVPKGVMSGELILKNISSITPDMCIIGCAGISTTGGLTAASSQEAPVNTLMLKQSHTHIIVADSTKIGIQSSFPYANISQIDILITDNGISLEQTNELKNAGVKEVLIANIETIK